MKSSYTPCILVRSVLIFFVFLKVPATTETKTEGTVGIVKCLKGTVAWLFSLFCSKKARLTGGPGIVWLITAVHTPPAIRKCLSLIPLSQPTRRKGTSYAVSWLKKKKKQEKHQYNIHDKAVEYAVKTGSYQNLQSQETKATSRS
ncbi:hypothetical protein, partial [Salmonella enterica]|uniref:hypothetical protein n=1 Tax=Salmonella enterica TaxID=28901 RepID=UPI001C60D88A